MSNSSMNNITLEDLQREMAETESYLRSKEEDKSTLRRSLSTLRSSKDATATNNIQLTSSTKLEQPSTNIIFENPVPEKPIDNREQLVQRLLSDYNARQSQSQQTQDISNNIRFSIQQTSSEDAAEKEFLTSLNTNSMDANDSSPRTYRPHEETLFFASDLADNWKALDQSYFSNKETNEKHEEDLTKTVKFAQSLQPWEKNQMIHPWEESKEPKSEEHLDPLNISEEYEDSLASSVNGRNQSYRLSNIQTSVDDNHATLKKPSEYHRKNTQFVPRSRSRSRSQGRRTASMSPQTRGSSSLTPTPKSYLKSKELLQKEAREKFDQTCTFSPQLYTNKSNSKGNKSSSLSPSSPSYYQQKRTQKQSFQDKLEEMQIKHEKKLMEREKLKLEAEQISLVECTFQPQITSKAYKMKKDRSQIDVSTRLYQEAEIKQKQHHWLGQQIEENRMAEYTFQPSINPNSREYLASNTNSAIDIERPIHERIADLQREKQRRLHELRASIELEQTDLTFQPKIYQNSKALAEAKRQKEFNIPPSHTSSSSPIMISGTEEALKVLDAKEDIGTRLLNEGRKMAKRKQQLLHERERRLAELYEPPTLSKGTKKLAEEREFVKVNFETRQKYYQAKVLQKQDERNQILEQNYQSWFTPALTSETQTIIAKSRPELLTEKIEDRIQRLAHDDVKTISENKKKLEDELYGQITFSPEIDPISKLFGRQSTVEELHTNSRGKERKSRLCDKLEQEMYQHCTFQPSINDLSRKYASQDNDEDDYQRLYKQYQQDYRVLGYGELAPNDSLEPSVRDSLESSRRSNRSLGRLNLKEPEKMLLEYQKKIQEKEESRRDELIAREIKELQDCTFHPHIQSDYSQVIANSEKTVIIKGLGRHLELRTMAQKLKDEAKDRERNAFSVVNVDKYRRPEDGSTIIEEFQFRGGGYSNRYTR